MKLILLIFLFSTLFASKPEIFLLNKYSEDINVTSWYMSEKLDGVRAYWDGNRLISRSGKIFSAPAFFTKEFPKHKLDGELWSKRGDFSNISSIVNQQKPHSGWKNLTYNVFEIPEMQGDFLQRLERVKSKTKYLKTIEQIRVKDKKHLEEFLKSVEEKGGEGAVVRNGELSYYTGRDNNALKVKSYIDEECEVIGYNKGQGKYENQTGSLSCEMKNTQVINIGSGLDDYQRANPPKIGAMITFKYYGLTSNGRPRFPVFLHIRE
ncbi:DNA ligase [Candidatus Sulfurimonas marisnigri]|uniref:DNA ligase n=1 Tax=Candidatus Sulfurimonas marisnigri TaxID=2740405 RepID=A0A7S7RPZ7_9BACT|nr:DNA ligase [Candidatus Sulfurimonas marisnigri]QOY54089.1 DNA ligase [Candidatus Sulfurimonas marisnigri]